MGHGGHACNPTQEVETGGQKFKGQDPLLHSHIARSLRTACVSWAIFRKIWLLYIFQNNNGTQHQFCILKEKFTIGHLFYFILICVCACVYVCLCECIYVYVFAPQAWRYPWRPGKDIRSPDTGVTGSDEPHQVGTENQTQTSCKNSMYPWLLCQLPSSTHHRPFDFYIVHLSLKNSSWDKSIRYGNHTPAQNRMSTYC